MDTDEFKNYQLRVRISQEEKTHLEKLRLNRGGEPTISDLVREGIALLIAQSRDGATHTHTLGTRTQGQVDRLADLLRREPRQVAEACVEGVFDLIEGKCEVPLIVMETQLHMKYRKMDGSDTLPWKDGQI